MLIRYIDRRFTEHHGQYGNYTMDDRKKKVNECLLRLQKYGTSECVEELYDLICPAIRHIGLKYLHDADLADDFVQDFWADIYKITDQYLFGFNAYAFLCKVAANRAIDCYRRLKGEAARIAYVEYSQIHSENAADQALNLAVNHAMHQLPEIQRIIIQSTYFEDKTVRQIAAELNMSKSQVSRMKTQALEKLKAYLES